MNENNILNKLIDWFMNQWGNFNHEWLDKSLYITIGITIIGLLIFISDFVFKKIFSPIIQRIVNQTKFDWDNVFVEKRVFTSIIHLISIGVGYFSAPYLLNETPFILVLIHKIFDILLVFIFIQFVFKLINAFLVISTDENNYRTIAVRTFSQTLKIIFVIFGLLIVASIVFNLKINSIITGLSATTAILILVFRDTILGFVSGIQIASSKTVKVGDWIEVDKYNISGTVKEINLVSAKIENFDRTISTIPTYDLISTKVQNYEPISELQVRRIKRSIYFDIKSFTFLTQEDLEKYKEIVLLRDYINDMQEQIKPYSQCVENELNNLRLTNIGLFRIYVERYLRSLNTLNTRETLLVRQKEISPKGLPLEIYCFTNTANWVEYEKIQSDIFDHLVTATKDFKLEIIQTISI